MWPVVVWVNDVEWLKGGGNGIYHSVSKSNEIVGPARTQFLKHVEFIIQIMIGRPSYNR